jgi:hypothetical protein
MNIIFKQDYPLQIHEHNQTYVPGLIIRVQFDNKEHIVAVHDDPMNGWLAEDRDINIESSSLVQWINEELNVAVGSDLEDRIMIEFIKFASGVIKFTNLLLTTDMTKSCLAPPHTIDLTGVLQEMVFISEYRSFV